MSKRRPPAEDVPLHEQVRAALHDMILSGQVRPGEKLPSEREICARFGVSRVTAIRALNEVAASGLAARRQGHGTVVTHPRVQRSFDTTMGLSEAARGTGLTTRATVLERRRVPATDIPPLLQPAPAAPCIRITRLRFLGALPAVISVSWIEEPLAARLEARDLTDGSLHDAFARITGQRVEGSHAVMAPIAAGRVLAARLGVPRGSAHLLFHSTTELADGTVVERTRSIFRGDMFEFSARMRRLPHGDAAGASAASRGKPDQPAPSREAPTDRGRTR